MIGVRDIKAKYKQAALGPLWLLIAPLGMLVAMTIAFSGVTDVDTGDIPYVPVRARRPDASGPSSSCR